MKHTTREEWLNDVAQRMRPMFTAAGAKLPAKFRITMSLTKRSKAIGTCYDSSCRADGHFEILVRLDQHEPERVADILAHELVHAAVGVDVGHKGRFRTVATAIGLEGKMTATTGGDAFKRAVSPILRAAGPFPHAPLDWQGKRSGPRKQGTRMLKCECEACGYVARTTSKWIDTGGPPICPCNGEPMQLDGEEDGD